jgi:hypothetical protein
MSSAQIIRMDWSDIWIDPRPIKALVLGYRDKVKGNKTCGKDVTWKFWALMVE